MFFLSVKSLKTENTSHDHSKQLSLEAEDLTGQTLETGLEDDGKACIVLMFNLGKMTTYLKNRSNSYGI